MINTILKDVLSIANALEVLQSYTKPSDMIMTKVGSPISNACEGLYTWYT